MKRGDDGVIQEIVDPFYFTGPLRIEHLRMTYIKGGNALHFIRSQLEIPDGEVFPNPFGPD